MGFKTSIGHYRIVAAGVLQRTYLDDLAISGISMSRGMAKGGRVAAG